MGYKDPLKEGMATHSSILAWRILGQRSLVDYSPQGCRAEHNWNDLAGTHIEPYNTITLNYRVCCGSFCNLSLKIPKLRTKKNHKIKFKKSQ